jgi:hypothetical protein
MYKIINFINLKVFKIIYKGAYLEATAKMDMKNQNSKVTNKMFGESKNFKLEQEIISQKEPKRKILLKIFDHEIKYEVGIEESQNFGGVGEYYSTSISGENLLS